MKNHKVPKVLFLAAVLTLFLIGCGSKKEEALSVESAQEQLVPEVLGTFSDLTLPGEELPAVLVELEARVTVEAKEVLESEEGYATVLLSVSAPDLAWVLEEVGEEAGSNESALDRALADAISRAPMREREVEAAFYQENGSWVPVMTDELFDACYGGILTLQEGGEGNE